MDMLGGSPQPDQLPDWASLHRLGLFSKWVWLCSAATPDSHCDSCLGGGFMPRETDLKASQPTEAHVPRETSRHRSGAGSQAAPTFRPATRRATASDAIAPRSSNGMAHGRWSEPAKRAT